jgi:signal transduction histidine kinase
MIPSSGRSASRPASSCFTVLTAAIMALVFLLGPRHRRRPRRPRRAPAVALPSGGALATASAPSARFPSWIAGRHPPRGGSSAGRRRATRRPRPAAGDDGGPRPAFNEMIGQIRASTRGRGDEPTWRPRSGPTGDLVDQRGPAGPTRTGAGRSPDDPDRRPASAVRGRHRPRDQHALLRHQRRIVNVTAGRRSWRATCPPRRRGRGGGARRLPRPRREGSWWTSGSEPPGRGAPDARAGRSSPAADARRELAPAFSRLGLHEELRRLVESAPRRLSAPALAFLESAANLAIAVGDIRVSIEAITRMVKALRHYSHLDRAEMAEADLHDGLETTLTILRNQIRYGIVVERRYSRLPAVQHERARRVRPTSSPTRSRPWRAASAPHDRDRRHRGGVSVRISDTARASDAIRGRIFDPFFTTKDQERHRSRARIAHQVVQRHRGDHRRVRAGRTSFEVRLPQGRGRASSRVRGRVGPAGGGA